MNGPGHRLLGMASALELADLAGWPLLQTAGAVAVAGITAHGRTSPDVDQFDIWRHWLGRLFPKGWREHRGTTHWWGWQALGAALLACGWLAARTYAPAWAPWWWLPGAVLVGWTSHLVGDALFGLGKGIPLRANGDGHVGLMCFKVGGRLEQATTWVVLPLALAFQAWLVTGGHAADAVTAALALLPRT